MLVQTTVGCLNAELTLSPPSCHRHSSSSVTHKHVASPFVLRSLLHSTPQQVHVLPAVHGKQRSLQQHLLVSLPLLSKEGAPQKVPRRHFNAAAVKQKFKDSVVTLLSPVQSADPDRLLMYLNR